MSDRRIKKVCDSSTVRYCQPGSTDLSPLVRWLLWRRWENSLLYKRRKRHPNPLWVGMQTGTSIMKNCMEIPQKTNNRSSMGSGCSNLGNIAKGKQTSTSNKYLHSHVYSSSICNSEDTESTQESISDARWTITPP